MLGSLGMTEVLLILVVVMLLFGARKLPQVGAGLGRGIQNFKAAMRGGSDEDVD